MVLRKASCFILRCWFGQSGGLICHLCFMLQWCACAWLFEQRRLCPRSACCNRMVLLCLDVACAKLTHRLNSIVRASLILNW